MLNRCIIVGRMVRDPELKRTQSGISVTSFTLAVERDIKSKDGEKGTDFIDVVAWRHSAEYVCKYIPKGSMAIVSGRLQIRNWKDSNGNNRKNVEIQADQVYSYGNNLNQQGREGEKQKTQSGQEYFEEITGFEYDLPDEFNNESPF